MSQRYFFHLVNCTDQIIDPIGVDVIDAAQARTEAEAVIEEMRSEGDLPGNLSGWNLEVRTRAGELVHLIPLAEAGFLSRGTPEHPSGEGRGPIAGRRRGSGRARR